MHTIPRPTSLAVQLSGSKTAEMQTSQRKHDATARAIRAFQEAFPHVVPDRNTPCAADMGQDTAGCRDFWILNTDKYVAAVCRQHVRGHICMWDKKFCDRCSLETGVCPVTDFPGLSRFGSVEAPKAIDVDVDAVLADYARALGILTRLEQAPRRDCGAHCPRWWPHPSGRVWVCQTHHWTHRCAPDAAFCEFVADDTGNSDTTACPISGLTGRSGRVFAAVKRPPTRVPRIKVEVSRDWVACCVRAVLRNPFAEWVDTWAEVMWQLLSLSGLAATRDHQWIFDAVIGVLTVVPMQGVVVRGTTLIPELAYMVAWVPDKLLAGMAQSVTMSTGRFSDLRNHEIRVVRRPPRRITVAARAVFDTLNALPPDSLALLADTLAVFFPNLDK
jgi:hypothetical protein